MNKKTYIIDTVDECYFVIRCSISFVRWVVVHGLVLIVNSFFDSLSENFYQNDKLFMKKFLPPTRKAGRTLLIGLSRALNGQLNVRSGWASGQLALAFDNYQNKSININNRKISFSIRATLVD